MEKQPFPTSDRKVSVIVPALNESETVASVVEFARRCPLVDEVIVVDDGSVDGTPELASAAGAVVFTSTMLGKGVSMEDGLHYAKNETVLYLDGDLSSLSPDVIERMVEPILTGNADFVKARFTRSAGRVTTLTARPLLKTYFPEIAHFVQPLSGVMAARKSFLEDLRFENDYGVDIGLFIDAAMNHARVAEVDIGHIDHDSHPLAVLEEMATQVARTILDRAATYGRLRYSYIREVQEDERHRKAELSNVLQHIPKCEQLALFDMDGVLLKDRFIRELAKRTEKESQLAEFLDRFDMDVEERARKIAAIFTGVARSVFEQTAREMPLTPGAAETIVGLRKAGFRVGIVTDSYHVAAEIVRRRVFADFSFANLMRFKNGKASGGITLAPGMVYAGGCSVHKHCKVNVMRHLMERMEIGPDCVLAVGDGENDVCMLQAAGVSVAFEPKTENVRAAGQHIVEGNLTGVLEVLQK
ncbi:MAG: HAD-IB family phosphatase [Verrucomicrobia bacterium]|nr:HAD-IB family phosphatase [Verrucomicrobiota bacterium]